jgi:hypothetical protein
MLALLYLMPVPEVPELVVPLVPVPEVPELEVPDVPVVPVLPELVVPLVLSIVPLEVALEDELPAALVSGLVVLVVLVELQAVRLMAIRPAITTPWNVFMILSYVVDDRIMGLSSGVQNRMSPSSHVGRG